MTQPPGDALVLICRPDGATREILRSDPDLPPPRTGMPFTDFLDASSSGKGRRFLTRVVSGQTVTCDELCFNAGGAIQLRSVAGIRVTDQLLIVAAKSESALRAVIIDTALKRVEFAAAALNLLAAGESAAPAADVDTYADYARMYNEFARLQRAYAQQNAKLTRLSAQKDFLLDTVAHDLRNPLSAISLLASGVLEDAHGRLIESEASSLQRVIETVNEMAHLIDQLLDQAREAGGTELVLSETDVARFVADRVERILPLAEASRITVQVYTDEALRPCRFDAPRMQRVVDNLLGNAIKFSPQGTCVTVKTEATQHGLKLSVTDQGPGIPADQLRKIFEPFFRATSTATQAEPGNGLGLSICRNIVDAHGGNIRAENRAEGGTAVYVELPC